MAGDSVMSHYHRRVALEALRTFVAGQRTSARAVDWRTRFTNSQLLLLRELASAGALSVTELAQRTRTTQSTVSAVVGRLIEARLVHGKRSTTDRRRAALTLTPTGRRLLRRAPITPADAVPGALAALTSVQARGLANGLVALLAALGVRVESDEIS